MRETAKALAAFERYWALGEQRSLARVARDCSKSASLINHWSAEHRWQDRVKARIAEQADAADRQRAQQVAEVEALLLTDGRTMAATAMALLERQAKAGKLGNALAPLLAQARASMLRGLRQPESITRQETTGKDGGPVEIAGVRDEIARKLARLAAVAPAPGDPAQPE